MHGELQHDPGDVTKQRDVVRRDGQETRVKLKVEAFYKFFISKSQSFNG